MEEYVQFQDEELQRLKNVKKKIKIDGNSTVNNLNSLLIYITFDK